MNIFLARFKHKKIRFFNGSWHLFTWVRFRADCKTRSLKFRFIYADGQWRVNEKPYASKDRASKSPYETSLLEHPVFLNSLRKIQSTIFNHEAAFKPEIVSHAFIRYSYAEDLAEFIITLSGSDRQLLVILKNEENRWTIRNFGVKDELASRVKSINYAIVSYSDQLYDIKNFLLVHYETPLRKYADQKNAVRALCVDDISVNSQTPLYDYKTKTWEYTVSFKISTVLGGFKAFKKFSFHVGSLSWRESDTAVYSGVLSSAEIRTERFEELLSPNLREHYNGIIERTLRQFQHIKEMLSEGGRFFCELNPLIENERYSIDENAVSATKATGGYEIKFMINGLLCVGKFGRDHFLGVVMHELMIERIFKDGYNGYQSYIKISNKDFRFLFREHIEDYFINKCVKTRLKLIFL